MTNVYFIGAGPGDPDLITVKGKKIVEKADVIIYAGSLVNKEIIDCRKNDSALYNSASMTLEEVIECIETSVKNNLLVARVHTGDPSIYGAIREQIDILTEKNIECVVIPGVSSFTAACCALKKEFTLPDVSQTVICTRLEGRTPVPENESLELLASHKASMAIFLSIQMIDGVIEKLLKHYDKNTKIAVVEKVSWPSERIITGELINIAEKVKNAGIKNTGMILVGDFLGDSYSLSKLYDKNFSHLFRDAKCGE